MSLDPSASPGRARGHMARFLFFVFWMISLLPILILGGLGYSLFSAQVHTFASWQWQRVGLTVGGVIVLLALLSAWLARRMARPVQHLVTTMSSFAGGDLEQRAALERKDELGQLAELFNTVADEMKELYNLISIREGEEQGGEKRSALMQLAQIIDLSPEPDELQRRALEMIVKMFACSFAALYLIERTEPVGVSYAVLTRTFGRLEGLPGPLGKRFSENRINLDATPTMEWLVSKAIATRRAQVGPASEMPGAIGSGVMEACLPLIRRGPGGSERLVGVLDLYAGSRLIDSRLGPFANRPLGELQAIANLLALALNNLGGIASTGLLAADKAASGSLGAATSGKEDTARELAAGGAARPGAGETPSTPLKASSAETLSATPSLLPLASATLEIFFAASREIAQASEPVYILSAVGGALRQSPFVTALLIRAHNNTGELVLEVIDCRHEPVSMRAEGQADLEIEPLQTFFQARQGITVIVDNVGKRLSEAKAEKGDAASESELAATAPQALLEVAQRIGAEAAAFIPVMDEGRLTGLLVVGRPPRPALRTLQSPPLNPVLLEPYANLAYLATTALERVRFQGGAQRRLAELESLWQVSQTIAAETHLQSVFPILHQQLETVMGKVNAFATFIYESSTNQVLVPYMYENGSLLEVPSFQLGDSLTSHVIRTRQPLLLRNQQEVEAASQKVGMRRIGEPAQSWLGVPMLFGGEVLGAIVVQDVRQEYRFDEEDQRLLTTLATQAAVVVRNARLLQASEMQVQHEQLVNEITDHIRRSVDIQSILQTTAEELGRALGASRAHIQIAVPGDPAAAEDGGFSGRAEVSR